MATPLFLTQILGGAIQIGGLGPQYDVSSDGQRFLVNRRIGEGKPGYILVIANWEALLKRSSVNQ